MRALERGQPRYSFGGLAEWSKAAVLKTVEPRGSRGSNPWPTAIFKKSPAQAGVFCIRTASLSPARQVYFWAQQSQSDLKILRFDG